MLSLGGLALYNLRQIKRLLEEFAPTIARWIRELPQGACVARMRICALFIITAIPAFQLQASSASTAASPPFSAAGIEFEPVTLPRPVNPECAIATPVRLKAVKWPPRWKIRLPDEPTLSCQFGERFGHWLRDVVAPLIAGELAVELKSVHTGPGYECRNRAETGKISAHASGLAVDVASFELANGRTLAIKPNGDEHLRATVDAIRVAACGSFTTVIGPGSDAAHAEHMHVDILLHGSSDRYRICQ